MGRANHPKARDSHEPVHARPIEVAARRDESPDRMIRRFCKKVRNEGVLQEVYSRRAYEKPSQRRRRKAARAAFSRKAELARAEGRN